jgi:hypothetical protein
VLKRGANFDLGLLKLGVSTWQLISERRREKALEKAVKEAWERLREGSKWEGDSHFNMVP